jgi:response regulator RpfG family c-di-GMP phosphodiesterase/tRNA A-37 threonylcarbamoyl transferase component Bud32
MNNTILLDVTRSVNESTANTLDEPSQGNWFLQHLLDAGVILLEDWQALAGETRLRLLDTLATEPLLALLAEHELLTGYQVSRVMNGNAHHLVLGNYRILDRIGAGGMGVVYRGEHRLLRRQVAIKVMQTPAGEDQILLQRFFVEMRSLARIRHANIVWALDAGTLKPSEHNVQYVHYLVMEYVKGTNLEQLVAEAPLNISQACELVYQIAGALDETHKSNLIHRDIKPSNILMAPDGAAKLLDFGLALHFGRRRLTIPGTLLGTLSYMAPEQVTDAANVDIRADIYGLGATLYFCLTGKPPFLPQGPLTQQVASRLTLPPPNLRAHRPDVPADLEAITRRMMAHHRDDRYPTPQSVMRAFLPYVSASSHLTPHRVAGDLEHVVPKAAKLSPASLESPRILIVDDEPLVRDICDSFFRREHFECQQAVHGAESLRMAADKPFDLVLLDIDMPGISGTEVLRRLRQNPPCNYLKIIMMSGGITPDEMSELLAIGADDYLTKPLSRHQLIARVKAALLHKAAQDRSEVLNQQLLHMNTELECTLSARNSDLAVSRNAVVFALAKIVESRSNETAEHLTRMTHYASCLAQEARCLPRFEGVLDEPFIKTLESCTILHDIGNVALPDHILRPAGEPDAEDCIMMQSHTTIGAETLKSVAKRDRGAAAFWQMATDIARHHHERFDGKGYPDRLSGNDIPLAARIVALADAYDDLRTAGVNGLALSHNAAIEILLEGSRGRFDPLLLQAFHVSAPEFERIYRTYPDEPALI